MNDKPEILVIASDPETRKALSSILQTEGLKSVQASHLSEGRALLATETVGMVFCERNLSDGTYLDLLPAAQTKSGIVPVVVTSRLADWDEYLEALRHGAVDLIASPFKPSDVSAALAQARREKATAVTA
ncbi:MAG TPA: response regulator [Candidatus Acidoferrum sp.]|jgi:DNA-binding NtrC family response regulator